MLDTISLYREMYTIRKFEQTILDEFASGVFSGTTHTYLGQEANAVGIICQLQEQDLVFSNHRCHGHYLAYGGNPTALYAELMGKPSGIGAGRGGSQHIHFKNFFSNGIQGSAVPIAAGAALAEKKLGTGAICISLIGDGTLGEGILYETLNMASLWNAPVLFVVENNRIAQTTDVHTAIAGNMLARFSAFDIQGEGIDSSNVTEIQDIANKWIGYVREQQKPAALIIDTHRFGPHSKGDDTRSKEIVEELIRTRDPLKIIQPELKKTDTNKIEAEINRTIENSFLTAKASPKYNQS